MTQPSHTIYVEPWSWKQKCYFTSSKSNCRHRHKYCQAKHSCLVPLASFSCKHAIPGKVTWFMPPWRLTDGSTCRTIINQSYQTPMYSINFYLKQFSTFFTKPFWITLSSNDSQQGSWWFFATLLRSHEWGKDKKTSNKRLDRAELTKQKLVTDCKRKQGSRVAHLTGFFMDLEPR